MDISSILDLAGLIPTETDAYCLLEELRWESQPQCPHCGAVGDHHFIQPTNGRTRRTTRGTQTVRRIWRCNVCRKQFSVLTGTMMHGTHVPVRTWLFIMYDMASAKNGISAREVERKYNLGPKTAWYLCHRVREAMRWDYTDRFEGVVMADEAYIGGDPNNRHAHKRTGKDGRGTDKTPVVTMVNKETGEVRSRVVPNVSQKTLGRIISDNVVMEGSTLVTDKWSGYQRVGALFSKHEQLDHSAGEYARGDYSTNAVETFFSQLKRSLTGTHHRTSPKHLEKYTTEFDFRISTHEMSDGDRLCKLIGQSAGRRMTYRDLVAG